MTKNQYLTNTSDVRVVINSNMRSKPRQGQSPITFDRFESLARHLLHVSKGDVREAGAGGRDKHRSA